MSERKKFEVVEQQYVPHGKKHYDKLTVKPEEGAEESYFFDITSFFGKFAPELDRSVKG